MTDGAEKYRGQKRWRRDVADIVRIATRPAVGKDTKIGGKAVSFDAYMIDELLRRREVSTESDGLASRAHDQGSGGGSSDMTQTERAALRGLPGADDDRKDDWRRHEQPDPVGRIVEEALADLDIVARHMRRFEKKLSVILNANALVRGRVNTTEKCIVCDRPVIGAQGEILHRGRYCNACNTDWKRAGRPHEVAERQWARARREKLEAEGQLYSQSGAPVVHAEPA